MKKRAFCAVLAALCVLLLSGCAANKLRPKEHLEDISSACAAPGNAFPAELFSVEFTEYASPEAGGTEFRYGVRFTNISGRAVETEILSFYDPELDKLIEGSGGSLQDRTLSEPITLEPDMSWDFNYSLVTKEAWDGYTREEQATLRKYGREQYFEIIADGETYSMILDFEAQKIITER